MTFLSTILEGIEFISLMNKNNRFWSRCLEDTRMPRTGQHLRGDTSHYIMLMLRTCKHACKFTPNIIIMNKIHIIKSEGISHNNVGIFRYVRYIPLTSGIFRNLTSLMVIEYSILRQNITCGAWSVNIDRWLFYEIDFRISILTHWL